MAGDHHAVLRHLSRFEATNTLITSIDGNPFPNDEGREQRRLVTLEGDELKQVNLNPGSGGRAEMVFKRTK
jgi:hypothetical protein